MVRAPEASSIFKTSAIRSAPLAVLTFSGTGARQGYTWFAIETGSETGGDFADLILLVNLAFAPVELESARWGDLKQRFR